MREFVKTVLLIIDVVSFAMSMLLVAFVMICEVFGSEVLQIFEIPWSYGHIWLVMCGSCIIWVVTCTLRRKYYPKQERQKMADIWLIEKMKKSLKPAVVIANRAGTVLIVLFAALGVAYDWLGPKVFQILRIPWGLKSILIFIYVCGILWMITGVLRRILADYEVW